MPVPNYGVWAGHVLSYTAETNEQDSKSPHIQLTFDDGQGNTERAAINVKSIGKESRLVYWVNLDFKHPLTQTLKSLPLGFTLASSYEDDTLGLDFQRTQPELPELSRGRLLPHDIPGANNDVLDEMRPILDRAVNGQSTVYIFGSRFRDGTGIHDVHMNQGSLPKFENGVFQDGAMFFYYPDEDRFEAVFLAFASQMLPTNDRGLALQDSQTLIQIVVDAEQAVPTANL